MGSLHSRSRSGGNRFGPRHAAAGAKWESATQAYQEICAYCHDTGVGPSLRKGAYTASHVQHVVRHGFNAMPAFLRADIDDRTLSQLADLIAKDKLP
jgi:4-cresol dehydrogenase (hydroxylating) cytochrome subunit